MKDSRLAMVLTTVVVSLAIVMPAHAADASKRQKRLEPYFNVQRPEGGGPFPAVMMVSGCSGFAPEFAPGAYATVAEQLKGEGSVVIHVDYLAARGFRSCRDRGGIGGFAPEIGQDVLAAAAYLRGQPFVNASDIVAIGWSMGGGGVLAALSALRPSDPLPFRAVVAFYPACSDVKPWKTSVPALLLLAGRDDIAPAAECQAVVKKLPAGAPVEVRVYPTARHGFDVAELPAELKQARGTLGHDPAATRAAWEEIRNLRGR